VKRATREIVRRQIGHKQDPEPLTERETAALDILDSDARQRREIRALRTALRDIMTRGSGLGFTEYEIAVAALARKAKR
jgi:hypothetical protein